MKRILALRTAELKDVISVLGNAKVALSIREAENLPTDRWVELKGMPYITENILFLCAAFDLLEFVQYLRGAIDALEAVEGTEADLAAARAMLEPRVTLPSFMPDLILCYNNRV